MIMICRPGTEKRCHKGGGMALILRAALAMPMPK
jgi:hypothetical protein